MANLFAASIYGTNNQSIGTAQGQSFAFPSQNVIVRPAPLGSVFNTVTCNAIIQLIPSGTVVNQPQYYTPMTVAQVVTASNA